MTSKAQKVFLTIGATLIIGIMILFVLNGILAINHEPISAPISIKNKRLMAFFCPDDNRSHGMIVDVDEFMKQGDGDAFNSIVRYCTQVNGSFYIRDDCVWIDQLNRESNRTELPRCK